MATAKGGAMAAPSRLALWEMPCTMARSRRGNQSCMERVAVGNAPASPMPVRKRKKAKEDSPVAVPSNATVTDQKPNNAVNTRRGPNRSPSQPPGIWNIA